MNISNHCYQRYHERVREKNTPFVDSLKEQYSKEIEKLYTHCTKKTPEMAIEGIPANGRVVAKFTLRKIWAYINGARWKDGKPGKHDDYLLDAICTRARLKEDDLWAYSPDLAFYAWFVEDVELLEKPLELSHFGVNVAPQTWRYINL